MPINLNHTTNEISFPKLKNYTETIDTSGGTTLASADAHVHYVSYSAATTITIDLSDGQSMLVMINAGAHAITWSATALVWVGGSAPSPLNSSGYTAIEFWKVNNVTFGALVGDL